VQLFHLQFSFFLQWFDTVG